MNSSNPSSLVSRKAEHTFESCTFLSIDPGYTHFGWALMTILSNKFYVINSHTEHICKGTSTLETKILGFLEIIGLFKRRFTCKKVILEVQYKFNRDLYIILHTLFSGFGFEVITFFPVKVKALLKKIAPEKITPKMDSKLVKNILFDELLNKGKLYLDPAILNYDQHVIDCIVNCVVQSKSLIGL